MSSLSLISLLASAVVFAIWAYLMFRALFAMRRRVFARTEKLFPGPIEALREFGIWLRDPTFRQERRGLLFMTIAVLAISYLISLSSAAAS